MRPREFSYTPADNSLNGYANDITGVGPFTMSTTTAGDNLAHLTTIDSAANLSALTFTLTGTDADGLVQTEAIVGPNVATVTGVKYFKTLTTVSASSTLGANTADIGWNDTAIGPTFPLNWRQIDFQVSLGVDISGTINYSVQHCFESLRDAAPSTLTWWPHATIVSKTADTDGNYASPVTATRLLVNSLTAGATIAFQIIQGN